MKRESWPSGVSDHLYPSIEQLNIVNKNIYMSALLGEDFFSI